MAEEKAEDTPPQAAPPKSKKLLWGLATFVLVAAAGVGGVFVGPALGLFNATAAPAEDAPGEAEAEPTEQATPAGKPASVVNMMPIVVDIRDASHMLHHLKVGLSAELPEGVTNDQFRQLEPRGREAAIAYLRGLTFEHATQPDHFPKIRDELRDTMIKAIGKDLTLGIVITDFVAQ